MCLIFFDFAHVPTAANPLQPFSKACSIEVAYPREWQIAIPQSLTQVDKESYRKRHQKAIFVICFFSCLVCGEAALAVDFITA